MVQRVGKGMGHQVEINHIKNPRIEAEEHYYNPTYQGLLDLGIKPHLLNDISLEKMFREVERYSNNINSKIIFQGIKW